MSLETALIIGFICHLIGDYLLQNNWMAQNKTKSFFPCMIHIGLYMLPFCILLEWYPEGSYTIALAAGIIIGTTHYFIDRYDLAKYWIMLVNWSWGESNYGYGDNMPPVLAIFLKIIIDNTFHLIINSICLYYVFG